jgi:hypothetical protein
MDGASTEEARVASNCSDGYLSHPCTPAAVLAQSTEACRLQRGYFYCCRSLCGPERLEAGQDLKLG